jgi:uncharacterized protein
LKYFVDTSFWCALYDAGDYRHLEAKEIWKTLAGKPVMLYTSDYVFDETTTLISRKIDRQSAIDFGVTILQSKVLSILQVHDNCFSSSWLIFKEYGDKDFSFTDCTSFALMQTNGIKQALAFDRHFTRMGFSVNQI